MKSYKIYNESMELYFPDVESIIAFFDIEEDLFQYIYDNNIKYRGFWIDRPQYSDDEIEAGVDDLFYRYKTSGMLSNGMKWEGNKYLMLLDQLITYHKDNKSELGSFITNFIDEIYNYCDKSNLTYLDKEDIIELIVTIGEDIDPNRKSWLKFLNMYMDLI